MFAPDAFNRDPYGYLTNQVSHGYLGMFAITFYCWSVLHLTGEYPNQSLAGVVLVCLYFAVWEIGVQGWHGSDTIEDTYFTAMGVVPWFFIDMSQIIDKLFVWEFAVAVSLAVGTAVRVRNARQN